MGTLHRYLLDIYSMIPEGQKEEWARKQLPRFGIPDEDFKKWIMTNEEYEKMVETGFKNWREHCLENKKGI